MPFQVWEKKFAWFPVRIGDVRVWLHPYLFKRVWVAHNMWWDVFGYEYMTMERQYAVGYWRSTQGDY